MRSTSALAVSIHAVSPESIIRESLIEVYFDFQAIRIVNEELRTVLAIRNTRGNKRGDQGVAVRAVKREVIHVAGIRPGRFPGRPLDEVQDRLIAEIHPIAL